MEAGERPTLADLGGEETLLANMDDLAVSPYFGEVVEVLSGSWSVLNRLSDIIAFIKRGILKNNDRLALAKALDALIDSPPSDVQALIRAVDVRARDEQTAPVLRVDVATTLLRYALADEQWRYFAISALQSLNDVTDPYAGSMLCRLIALYWDHYHDPVCMEILERKIDDPYIGSNAALERGLIEIGQSLEQNGLTEIISGLQHAERYLSLACERDEDARSARIYRSLVSILVRFGQGQEIDRSQVEQLRDDALLHQLWDSPRPGSEWMFPQNEYRLQWMPMILNLLKVSGDLVKPSWLEASATLYSVLEAYTAERTVVFPFNHLERVIQPAIEASFVREAGLMRHLDDWVHAFGGDQLGARDAQMLRKNIERRAKLDFEGKRTGVATTGKRRLRKH